MIQPRFFGQFAMFTNEKSESTRNKANLERLNRHLTFVLLEQVGLPTIEPNYRLNGANNL